jgi:hypothetical protein
MTFSRNSANKSVNNSNQASFRQRFNSVHDAIVGMRTKVIRKSNNVQDDNDNNNNNQSAQQTVPVTITDKAVSKEKEINEHTDISKPIVVSNSVVSDISDKPLADFDEINRKLDELDAKRKQDDADFEKRLQASEDKMKSNISSIYEKYNSIFDDLKKQVINTYDRQIAVCDINYSEDSTAKEKLNTLIQKGYDRNLTSISKILNHTEIHFDTKIDGSYMFSGEYITDEGTIIDTAKDPKLKSYVDTFQSSYKDLSEEGKILAIKVHVYDFFGTSNNNLPETDSEIKLGDMPNNNKAVCRHYAGLTKLLADSVDIKCNYVSGRIKNEPHAWNEIKKNNGDIVLSDFYNVIEINTNSENTITDKETLAKYTATPIFLQPKIASLHRDIAKANEFLSFQNQTLSDYRSRITSFVEEDEEGRKWLQEKDAEIDQINKNICENYEKLNSFYEMPRYDKPKQYEIAFNELSHKQLNTFIQSKDATKEENKDFYLALINSNHALNETHISSLLEKNDKDINLALITDIDKKEYDFTTEQLDSLKDFFSKPNNIASDKENLEVQKKLLILELVYNDNLEPIYKMFKKNFSKIDKINISNDEDLIDKSFLQFVKNDYDDSYTDSQKEDLKNSFKESIKKTYTELSNNKDINKEDLEKFKILCA